MNAPPLKINGVDYETPFTFEIEYGIDGTWIHRRPEAWEAVNVCSKCHRFDTREVVARSWDEALALGWLARAGRGEGPP